MCAGYVLKVKREHASRHSHTDRDNIYIYIYREREREIDIERERDAYIYIYIYIHTHIYMYIYIYIWYPHLGVLVALHRLDEFLRASSLIVCYCCLLCCYVYVCYCITYHTFVVSHFFAAYDFLRVSACLGLPFSAERDQSFGVLVSSMVRDLQSCSVVSSFTCRRVCCRIGHYCTAGPHPLYAA